MRFRLKHPVTLVIIVLALAIPLFSLRSCRKEEYKIIEDGDFLIIPLSTARAIKSVRRPVAAGFYDSEKEKTFVSYMGKGSNPLVQSFDHKKKAWSKPKQVGRIADSRYYSGSDRHNYPTIIQLPNGKPAVFYAVHAKEMRISIASKKGSINGKWRDRSLKEAAFAAYPMPLKADNGDIYLFYRESSYSLHPELDRDDRPIQYLLSQDNAAGWQKSSELNGVDISIGSWHRPDNLNEIYLGQIRHQSATADIKERFHLVWTLSGGGYEGPKHDRYHKDVYYAYFLPENRHFYSAGGKDLGFGIDAQEMQECLAFDSGKLDSNNPKAIGYSLLLSWGKRAEPILVYESNIDGEIRLGSSTFRHNSWQHSSIPSANSIMDLERLDDDSFALYLGNGQIFVSHDGSKTWQYATSLKLPQNRAIAKIALIDNYRDPARLFVSEKPKSKNTAANTYLLGFSR